MRLYKSTRNVMLLLTFISAITTVILSIFQTQQPNAVEFSIANNIDICILTGCLIIFIQSIISFNHAKREALLNFYHKTMLLEKDIIDFPYLNSGFILAQDGFQEVRNIFKNFSDEFEWSYIQIDLSNKNDIQTKAATDIFNGYASLIHKFYIMEELLAKAIEFLDIPDAELLQQGIDIKRATQEHNDKLQMQINEIIKEFNDENKRVKRNTNLDIIEKYLFPDKVRCSE